MTVVGPGATPQVNNDVRPLLDGVTEYEYITVLNPLTDDFAVQVAQDIPVNVPFNIAQDTSGKVSQVTNSEQDVRQVYGLNLKNPDFQAKKHISNSVIIRSGETLNLKGNEAQVAVRQIVNELMQREGNSRLLSDPNLRREAEQRVIVSRGSIQSLMDSNLQTPRDQINQAIKQSNEVQNGEEAEFPGLSEPEGPAQETPARVTDSGAEDLSSEKRSPGRPKKA